MPRNLSQSEFITRAKRTHKDKFDYSFVKYKNYNTKVIIRCLTNTDHDNFQQTPSDHINGKYGCPKCAGNVKLSTKQFVKRAAQIHNNKFDYSITTYIASHAKVKILCNDHGVFEQNPNNHLSGQGCPECAHTIRQDKMRTVSESETKWLNSLKVPNKRQNRQVVIKINNTWVKVDGYVKKTNTVYEFYGDYWHGNPKIFNPNKIHPTLKISYKQIYQKTIQRQQAILNAGYQLIEIWENDWSIINKTSREHRERK